MQKFSNGIARGLGLPLAALLVSAVPAVAVEHLGSTVTLAFNGHDDSVGGPYVENNTVQLSGQSWYGFGGTYVLGVSVATAREEWEGDFYSATKSLGFHPGYTFENGKLGAFVSYQADNGSEEDYVYVGVEGNYDFGRVSIEGYAGKAVALNGDADDFTVLGVGAAYEISDAFSAYANVRTDKIGTGDDFGLASVGAEYNFDGFSGTPMTVFAEYSRFINNSGLQDWNQVTLGVTAYLGPKVQRSRFHQQYSMESYYD